MTPKATVSILYNIVNIEFYPRIDDWFFPLDNKRSFFIALDNKVLHKYLNEMVTKDTVKEIEYAVNTEIQTWFRRGDIVLDYPFRTR